MERQGARYFRLTIDERQVRNGFIIFCRSLNGNFKLVIFDCTGNVLHMQESALTPDRSQNDTSLYFTEQNIYNLGKPTPSVLSESDLPPVFNRLDGFTKCNNTINEGQFLVCVYGDNFIGKTNFSLLAVPMLADSNEVGRDRLIYIYMYRDRLIYR